MIRAVYILFLSACLLGCWKKSAEDSFQMGSEDYLQHCRFILDSLISIKDHESLAQLYSKSAVCLFDEMDEVSGRENIRKMYSEVFEGMDSVQMKSKVDEIIQENNWAIERSSYTFSFKPHDRSNREYRSGKVVTTYRNLNGKWHIVWQISNFSAGGNSRFATKNSY